MRARVIIFLFSVMLITTLIGPQQQLIVDLVKIQNDGTVEVDLAKHGPVASELLELQSIEGAPIFIAGTNSKAGKSIPRLKIVMLVVGTRGDVQPFLAMAKRLQVCDIWLSFLLEKMYQISKKIYL